VRLGIGDPVVITGTADTTGKYPVVTRATEGDGNYLTGAIVGFEPDADYLAQTYRTASTARYVYVADDPDLVFEAQEDSTGGALAATNVGQNISLYTAGSASTTTGLSLFELDSSTASTEQSAQCKILGLSPREDNAIGTNAKWLVMINLHTQRYTTGI
jgi:hypothetical protein